MGEHLLGSLLEPRPIAYSVCCAPADEEQRRAVLHSFYSHAATILPRMCWASGATYADPMQSGQEGRHFAVYLFVHTNHSQKAGPFSVARLKMDLPLSRVQPRSQEKCQPSCLARQLCQFLCSCCARVSAVCCAALCMAIGARAIAVWSNCYSLAGRAAGEVGALEAKGGPVSPNSSYGHPLVFVFSRSTRWPHQCRHLRILHGAHARSCSPLPPQGPNTTELYMCAEDFSLAAATRPGGTIMVRLPPPPHMRGSGGLAQPMAGQWVGDRPTHEETPAEQQAGSHSC